MDTCNSLFPVRRSKKMTNVTFPTSLVIFALNINEAALNKKPLEVISLA